MSGHVHRNPHNIDPSLIEGCLEQHPAVSMAAAVGMPDEYAGELPVAFVQLRAGSEVSGEDLQEYAMAHIAERPACPKRIIILDALPVTAVGKVFKPKLREDVTDALLVDLLKQRCAHIGIKARHTDTGQLVVQLWDVPASEEEWCRDQIQRLNLNLDALLVS